MEYKLRNVTNGVVIEVARELHEARSVALNLIRDYPHLTAVSISKHWSSTLVKLEGIQTESTYIDFSNRA